MDPGRLPIHEQIELLRATLCRNEALVDVLQRAQRLDAPNWYITAG